MIKFEKISAYKNDETLNLPVRKTSYSAGYDFEVAEDTTIPSYIDIMEDIENTTTVSEKGITYDEWTKVLRKKHRPTLVPTGIKCYMEPDMYLQLSVRSSTPLKSWLIMANSVGNIDADYVDNPDNEGHIYFQVINLSPYPITLKKGTIIGQGIFKKYYITDDDVTAGERIGGFGSTTK